MRSLLLLIVALSLSSTEVHAQRMRLERSRVSFISDAPLERIGATCTRTLGLLDPATRNFAVQVPVNSFEGFNSPLQKEHFNENYLLASEWPTATFQGRIIEAVDLSKPGVHDVRAKGMLTIRGEARERIIACHVVVHPLGVEIASAFDVVIEDHGMRIPRVVQQKIAATVRITADLQFARDPNQ